VLVAGGAYGHELHRRLPEYQTHRKDAFVGARAIGASFHERVALLPHLHDGSLDLCLLRYNSAHPGASDDVFPHAAGRVARLFNFKSTVGFVPPERCDELGLAAGHWRPDITDHYRFVLSRDELDGVLLALQDVDHVGALVDALARGPLEEAEQEHLLLLSKLADGKHALA
jgi:hypothetical protein